MRGRVEPSSCHSFLRVTVTIKNVRSRPQCCFRWWNWAKTELKGRFPPLLTPPEDGWERFSRIVFISTSLMPDLTSGLKGVSRVRQKCGESEHRCACASVRGARTCVPHVVLRCSAVVPGARRSPRSINHTYHLSACVTPEPTPATNQHREGGVVTCWWFYTSVRTHVNAYLRTDRSTPKKKSWCVWGWGGLRCQ